MRSNCKANSSLINTAISALDNGETEMINMMESSKQAFEVLKLRPGRALRACMGKINVPKWLGKQTIYTVFKSAYAKLTHTAFGAANPNLLSNGNPSCRVHLNAFVYKNINWTRKKKRENTWIIIEGEKAGRWSYHGEIIWRWKAAAKIGILII